MAVCKNTRSTFGSRLLARTMLTSPALLALVTAQQAEAQAQRVVSACSGVSLPRSAVTDILRPVITGIATPTENLVNQILDLPLLNLLPDLNLNATGLLNQAASGDPITLQVLARDGTVVGPADECRLSSDSLTLETQAGVAIGGNQITGLGANGAAAFSSDINAIAFGNNARAEAGAVGSIAIGHNSQVTAANSVALGAGSIATRGALSGYTSAGLAGVQNSAGEVSIGAPGALRQLTNVAAGSAATDAATVGQVEGVLAQVAAVDAASLQYDDISRGRATLAGAGGTTLANLAAGAIAEGSTEAVTGGQLFTTNQAVAANTGAITNIDGRVTTNTNAIAALDAASVRYDGADRAAITFGGAAGTRLTNVAAGTLAAGSTDAVTGGQLFATNEAVAANTGSITNIDGRVTTNTGAITNLDNRVTNIAGTVSGLDAAAVRYDAADRGAITLAGAAGTRITNLAPGALAEDSSDAVTGGQLYTTNQAVAANTGSITNIDGRVTTNTSAIAALDASAVRYDAADRALLTFGGAGGTVLDNVSAGALSVDSRQAVNGAQLFATNSQVAANTAAIATLGNGSAGVVRYSSPGSPTVPNGGTVTDDATLAGASGGPVGLHNLRGGVLAAGSTDAVNGDQLYTTNQAVATNAGAITNIDARVTVNEFEIANLSTEVTSNTTAITNLQNTVTGTSTIVNNLTTQVADNSTAITNINTSLANQPVRYANAATPTTPNGGTVSDDVTLAGASGGPVRLHNVAGGALVAGSTDAVNGDQLATTNTQVAANTTAITNFSNLVTGSTVSPVQYSNPDTPNRPNGGTLTNNVALVGANTTAPVGLHNIANGAVTETSTDAVNGQQLYAVANQASNSLQYDRDATGTRVNSVTLAGGEAGAAVALNNVAAGAVAVGSTQAVNGGQLYATAQVAQQAASLASNSVQYDAGNTSVTFNSTGSAVILRNVAAGVAPTDAVNLGQFQSGLQSAVNQANSYTDARLSAALESMNFNLREVRRDLGAGTSSALAAAGLPQANEPGRSMIAIGGGTYRGQSALAFGASTYLNDGHSIFRIGATIDSQGYGGANAGYGYQF